MRFSRKRNFDLDIHENSPFLRKNWANTLDRGFERIKILRKEQGRILGGYDLDLLDIESHFYSPKRNLPVGVPETRICPGRGPDMSG